MSEDSWFGLALGSFDVRGNDVVGLACGHALSKLALVVRHQLPLGFLLIRAANGDFNAVGRTLIRAIHGAKQKGIGIPRM